MRQVVASIRLPYANYANLQEWVLELADKRVARELDTGELIAQLLFEITNAYESPASALKLIAFEQRAVNVERVSDSPPAASTNPLYAKLNKSMALMVQTELYKFVTKTNSTRIHELTYARLKVWYKSLKWAIANHAHFSVQR